MDINSEAQKDLALDEQDAEGIAGGRELTKKAAKHHAKTTAPAAAAPRFIYQPAVSGALTVSADSGDDDCAGESGGDPGNQDGLT